MAKRHASSLRTMAETIERFPLFPLGLVLLPQELVPLHIFEERYKTMMARVLEEEGEFGIVWVSDDGLRPVGCACEIAEVLERAAADAKVVIVTGGAFLLGIGLFLLVVAIGAVAARGRRTRRPGRPFAPAAEIIRRPPDCAPCMLRDCPIDHRCMVRVPAERVAQAALDLLK